jgi:hydroxymethylbilane synthase
MKSLVIGTRGSQLALWQAHWIEGRLREFGAETRIEINKTTGDKITDVALAKVGSTTGLKGVFTKEIEEALLDGRIDVAVHSLKDLPTEIDSRLAIAAVPERADPRDALAGCSLDDLPAGARVGTGSLRRVAQLRNRRPDLEILGIRGNVDTRLRKMDEGQYDAVVLASAGLHRLGLEGRIAEILEPEVMCPAVGQGALGVQIRAGDDAVRELISRLNHEATAAAVTAERAVLSALGGGCQVPMGAHAWIKGGVLKLIAVVVSQDGGRMVRTSLEGAVGQAAELGADVAARLKDRGAAELLEAVYGPA